MANKILPLVVTVLPVPNDELQGPGAEPGVFVIQATEYVLCSSQPPYFAYIPQPIHQAKSINNHSNYLANA